MATATRCTAEASLKTGQLCWDFRMRGDRPRPAWARTRQAEEPASWGCGRKTPSGHLREACQLPHTWAWLPPASLAHGSLEPGGDVSLPRSSCPGPLPSHGCQPRSNSSRWRRSSGTSTKGSGASDPLRPGCRRHSYQKVEKEEPEEVRGPGSCDPGERGREVAAGCERGPFRHGFRGHSGLVTGQGLLL